MDDEDVFMCNPPLAYPRRVSELWNRGTVVICLVLIVCYVFTYLLLYKIAPGATASASQIRMQRAIVKTLTFNVVVFALSSVGSSALILLIGLLDGDPDTIGLVEAYAVIPALLSPVLNYYVFFWRSRDYQTAFLVQLPCIQNLKCCAIAPRTSDAVTITVNSGRNTSTITT